MPRLDHIGIAVKDLDSAIKLFKDYLGLELVETEEVPEEKVKVAIFKVGDSYIELLQGLTEDSAISKFIAKKGEGIHHIALRVDNVDELSRELRGKGLKVIYDKARSVAGGKRRINFIHPKSAHGVLIEILERVERGD